MSKVKSWLQKNQVMDNDLIKLLPKYGVNDPATDLKNLKPKQWKELQAKFLKDRSKDLKDSAAKLRLTKKLTKIDKLWKKEREKLPKKPAAAEKKNGGGKKKGAAKKNGSDDKKSAKKNDKKSVKKDDKKSDSKKKPAKKDDKKDTKSPKKGAKKDDKKGAKKDAKKDIKSKKDPKKKDDKKDAKKDVKKSAAKKDSKSAKDKDDKDKSKKESGDGKEDKSKKEEEVKPDEAPKVEEKKKEENESVVESKEVQDNADGGDALKDKRASIEAVQSDEDIVVDPDASSSELDNNSNASLMKLSRDKLVKRCKKVRIPFGGDKSELVKRLIKYYDDKEKEDQLAKQTNTNYTYNVVQSNKVLISEFEDNKVEDLDKEWSELINVNDDRFCNSTLINNKSYNLDSNKYYDYNNIDDIKPLSQSFKNELVDDNALFTEQQYNVLILKAKSIINTKEFKDKFKSNKEGGDYSNIKEGDPMGIEHVMAILIYVNLPDFVNKFRESLAESGDKYYYFGRFLRDSVLYFGSKMNAELTVYHGINNNDDLLFEYFNTSFITEPLSASGGDIFDDKTFVISLKGQFLNDFNDTNVLDISYFSKKKEFLFFGGKYSELSINNIEAPKGSDSYNKDVNLEWFKALNLWQKWSSGFADFNDKKYLIDSLNNDIQQNLFQLLSGNDAVPEYIAKLFKYYNNTKVGKEGYHRMYTEALDIDFSKICLKAEKNTIKELKELLFNDDISDIDPVKIQKIFINGKKYKNTLEEVHDFPEPEAEAEPEAEVEAEAEVEVKSEEKGDDGKKEENNDDAEKDKEEETEDNKKDEEVAVIDNKQDENDENKLDENDVEKEKNDQVVEEKQIENVKNNNKFIVSLNASEFKYNADKKTFTVSFSGAYLQSCNYNDGKLTFEIAEENVNKDKSSALVSDDVIDNVLDEIEETEKKLSAD